MFSIFFDTHISFNVNDCTELSHEVCRGGWGEEGTRGCIYSGELWDVGRGG